MSKEHCSIGAPEITPLGDRRSPKRGLLFSEDGGSASKRKATGNFCITSFGRNTLCRTSSGMRKPGRNCGRPWRISFGLILRIENFLVSKHRGLHSLFRNPCLFSGGLNGIQFMFQGTEVIAWNHSEFEVMYPSLTEEVRVGEYYLRVLLQQNQSTGSLNIDIKDPTSFFDELYRRFLTAPKPALRYFHFYHCFLVLVFVIEVSL